MTTMETRQTTTMKAIVQDQYGPPDVLKFEDVDKPLPKDDEVLVRVRAAGVNWADAALMTGLPYLIRPIYGLRKPKTRIRGTDVAGEVAAVGKNVTELQPGDHVFGWCTGAFAEYVSTPADQFVAKPPSMTFEQAAALPMAGCVALQALRDVAKIQPGQKVLINGASGGIGSFAVQIAKAFGADVTGVSSTANLDLVRSIGADHVIDYTRNDFTQLAQRYDLILDMADKHSLSARRRALTPKGTLIPNNGEGGRLFGSTFRIIKTNLASLFVSQALRTFVSFAKKDDLAALSELVSSGAVTPVVGRTYPLSDAPEAIGYVGQGHVRGKAVIIF
jgi:NADPH:quinone reductase-like Zn-dependent oxidoreductase